MDFFLSGWNFGRGHDTLDENDQFLPEGCYKNRRHIGSGNIPSVRMMGEKSSLPTVSREHLYPLLSLGTGYGPGRCHAQALSHISYGTIFLLIPSQH